jgi:hypothetical protein
MAISIDEAVQRLEELVKAEKLVLFAGTGISVPSGLPTWDQLMTKFIEFCRSLPLESKPTDFDALLDDCGTHAKGYPTRVASVLRNKLAEMDEVASQRGDKVAVEGAFRHWFSKLFIKAEPNDNHRHIVSTNYKFILTSNYDLLLEDAAEEMNYADLQIRSYSYHEADRFASAIYNEKPAIVHVHGKVTDTVLDRFVLTSEDYAKIGRDFPGFSLALASIFLQYSVLFIGYGSSDPHLEDILEVLAKDFSWKGSHDLPQFFLLLKSDKIGPVIEKYKERLRTTLIEAENYDQATEFLRALRDTVPRPV